MKHNRFCISSNFPILFLQGIIILFFAVSIVSLVNFRPTWFFSFDGISKPIRNQIEKIDNQTVYYDRENVYDLSIKNFKRVEILAKEMTISEAKQIIKYPNPVIKTAAYKKLLFSKSDKDSIRKYDLFCQILNENDIVQVALGDCGALVAPVGWFFMDTYLTFYEENINNREYLNEIKNEFKLTDSEIKHLVDLQQISERKIDSIYKALR